MRVNKVSFSTFDFSVRAVGLSVMKADCENNSSGCLVCLAVPWAFVKLVICCSCRSLERLTYPRPATSTSRRIRERTSQDLVVVDCEANSETSLPSGQKRVRFRSAVEVLTVRRLSGWTERPAV